MERHGFVLGKFAPLHKGHQYLIETALAECGRVTVLVYDCGFYPVPLQVRARWIRTLYPQVEVLEGWGGPECTGDSPEIMRIHEEYIRSMLGTRRITHFYSGEFYGAHVSRALGAVDRRVDESRAHVPVRATWIRENLAANRRFLSDVVFRDLVTKVVFLGSVSTGKSTIAEALAKRHGTTFMPEYGREYWAEHQVDRRVSPEQLVEIAEEHLRREEKAVLASNGVCFVDTNAITTYMFALDYHGSAPPRLAELARDCASRYDLVFLCGDEIPYDDTPDRSGDVKRHAFQRRIIGDLVERKLLYIPLHGTLEERMDKVDRALMDRNIPFGAQARA